MSKFKIIVDSTVDLSPELYKLIDPIIMPLNVHIGEETYRDYYEINAEKLYQKVAETKAAPKTSAVSPGLFKETFEKIKAEGYTGALFVGIGRSLSATVQSALLGAEEVEDFKVRVIDSHSLSTGSGLLALRAYDLRAEGKTLDEVADYLDTLGLKTRAQFIVDNLEMLAAGGRVTGIKLFFGRILRAHPFLQVNNDKLEVIATPKGKTERALDLMLEVAREEITAGLESPRVFITHTQGGERIDYLYNQLKEFVDPKNIYITEAGAVISSHCGAGTIGILYIRK
ncbi:MAG: DegV family protein [Bacillota bacterium]|nr:MAG: DegV family protein [Bacillota bacterium]